MSRVDTGEHGIIQVCMVEAIIPAFERWLAQRNAHLFRIPLEDDPEGIPTYAIGVN
jgi:hypothetical protein